MDKCDCGDARTPYDCETWGGMTPDDLAKRGYYPGEPDCRMVVIQVPLELIPEDSDLVDIQVVTNENGPCLSIFIGNKNFDIVPEGACIPVVGRVQNAGK